MDRIINNINWIRTVFKEGESNYYFPINTGFSDKKINRIKVYRDGRAGDGAVNHDDLKNIFLTLKREGGTFVVQNMPLSNIEHNLNFDIEVNCKIDFTTSFIRIADDLKGESLLFYFFYDEKQQYASLPCNNKTLIIPIDTARSEKFVLSDFLDGAFPVKVKAIEVAKIFPGKAYLTIREKAGRVFNDVSLDFFEALHGRRRFFVDDFDIDLRNSFLDYKDTGNHVGKDEICLTFYYD